MIELPESHNLAQQLQDAFAGKRVAQVEANKSPHGFGWFCGDPAAYPAMLAGKAVTGAWPNGGQVELALEDMRLVCNDGINIRYLAPDAQPPAKHQLLLRFEGGSGFVCTVQMYGGMMAFPAGTYDNPYYLVGKEKPTPYEDAFDEAYFSGLGEGVKPSLSVKAFLATEQRIPGLGNGVLQDILFYAGLLPQAKLREIGDAGMEALFRSVKSTLLQMKAQGGRNTEKNLFGEPGGYRCVLSAKTLPYPCPRCGGGITRKAYLGGNVYYCEGCQGNTGSL